MIAVNTEHACTHTRNISVPLMNQNPFTDPIQISSPLSMPTLPKSMVALHTFSLIEGGTSSNGYLRRGSMEVLSRERERTALNVRIQRLVLHLCLSLTIANHKPQKSQQLTASRTSL